MCWGVLGCGFFVFWVYYGFWDTLPYLARLLFEVVNHPDEEATYGIGLSDPYAEFTQQELLSMCAAEEEHRLGAASTSSAATTGLVDETNPDGHLPCCDFDILLRSQEHWKDHAQSTKQEQCHPSADVWCCACRNHLNRNTRRRCANRQCKHFCCIDCVKDAPGYPGRTCPCCSPVYHDIVDMPGGPQFAETFDEAFGNYGRQGLERRTNQIKIEPLASARLAYSFEDDDDETLRTKLEGRTINEIRNTCKALLLPILLNTGGLDR